MNKETILNDDHDGTQSIFERFKHSVKTKEERAMDLYKLEETLKMFS